MSEDLVAFIRARLDDDEAAGNRLQEQMDLLQRGGAWGSSSPTPPGNSVTMITAWTPARVLREVEAIRAIVIEHEDANSLDLLVTQDRGLMTDPPHELLGNRLLHHVAGIWRDHPDYDPEWKP